MERIELKDKDGTVHIYERCSKEATKKGLIETALYYCVICGKRREFAISMSEDYFRIPGKE